MVLGLIAGISVLVIATSLWALNSATPTSSIDRSILELPAPSIGQCEQLGIAIQRSINNRDAAVLDATMDWNAIMTRAAARRVA